MDLWHVSELDLAEGDSIPPGRWGEILLTNGQSEPFFFRELLLDLWRRTRTGVHVSRLACAFAYENVEQAREHARLDGQRLFRVAPMDPAETGFRADMLWLTWLGEAQSSFDKAVARCGGYWAGASTQSLLPSATPTWEWLLSSGLRVKAQEGV